MARGVQMVAWRWAWMALDMSIYWALSAGWIFLRGSLGFMVQRRSIAGRDRLERHCPGGRNSNRSGLITSCSERYSWRDGGDRFSFLFFSVLPFQAFLLPGLFCLVCLFTFFLPLYFRTPLSLFFGLFNRIPAPSQSFVLLQLAYPVD